MPAHVLGRLKLKFYAFAKYQTADRKRITLPVYSGKVAIRKRILAAKFIPGEGLIGVEFMSDAFCKLTVEFRFKSVTLN